MPLSGAELNTSVFSEKFVQIYSKQIVHPPGIPSFPLSDQEGADGFIGVEESGAFMVADADDSGVLGQTPPIAFITDRPPTYGTVTITGPVGFGPATVRAVVPNPLENATDIQVALNGLLAQFEDLWLLGLTRIATWELQRVVPGNSRISEAVRAATAERVRAIDEEVIRQAQEMEQLRAEFIRLRSLLSQESTTNLADMRADLDRFKARFQSLRAVAKS